MTSDPADLANLRDIVLPAASPWWPPAHGWWVISAGLFAAALVASIRGWKRYQANAYRREALRELDATSDVTAVMPILKRAAMAAYGRERVASLSGSGFLAFLDRTGGTIDFTSGPARLLPGLAFKHGPPPTPDEFATAVADARRWLRTHRVRGR
ncbi:DUF4381 domain-containing protein [Microvirga lotononidis]|uniref:DUF4381 domain-containing protein n=1 Tax=Microvirga lotononidis TaxID=864069 RepID=I4YN33_9HYPH|nr:DUF4381 domain-containing protein [Microvirga lotononidis]EIM25375.1 hypothetical protein MicloDRAFT_00061010 [Microvirga lotononidis]WQO27326.1 DUF4381 domain-containing protein [Microvirga lotononidis]